MYIYIINLLYIYIEIQEVKFIKRRQEYFKEGVCGIENFELQEKRQKWESRKYVDVERYILNEIKRGGVERRF